MATLALPQGTDVRQCNSYLLEGCPWLASVKAWCRRWVPSQLRWMEHWWWGRGWPSQALGAARKLGNRSTATGHGKRERGEQDAASY